MKDNLTRTLAGYRRTFTEFSTGQKLVAVIGTAALLLGGFMVFRWAAAPSYAPLFSDLSPADASAVIEQLDSSGVPYELAGGGGTVMVPRDLVYDTRIKLSGEGLPASTDGGYSLLDDQGLSTSKFQEQTDYKRAMEGELSKTIEAMDDVETAVVHLALPEKEVFTDEQDPATASVLLDTAPGTTLAGEQVQAVVHLVASSIDGLDPDKVTVADAAGTVLSAPEGSATALASARTQQSQAVQDQLHDKLQAMLDRVVGPGNSTSQVTVNLDFDKSVTETTDYSVDEDVPPLSSTTSTERYTGPAAANGVGGVVGPDGQMDPVASGSEASTYEREDVTQDNAVETTVERRETTPGGIESVHVGVALDLAATTAVAPQEIQRLVAATLGIDKARGDTVSVTQLPFDRSAEEAATKELEAAADARAEEKQWELIRRGALVLVVLAGLLLAWLTARRRNKARQEATSYVVEQLQMERARELAAAEAAALAASPATLALEQAEANAADELRDELAAIVEKQPEDVAALLRGWLVDRP